MSILSLTCPKHISVASQQIAFARSFALWPIKNPFKKEPEKPAGAETSDVLIPSKPDSPWLDLDEEQINKICDRSGLDDESKELELNQLFAERKFDQIRDYKRDTIRQFYAQYGKASGLKSGICWPNKDELEFVAKYEETFYPTLGQLMKDLQAEKKRIEKLKKERERLVAEGMAKRDQILKEFYEKRAVKLEEEEKERIRSEKLVAEVREYLGFNIEKSDPRFQEALAKKEEEERARIKAAAKKDKSSKIADMLQKMLDIPLEEITQKANKPSGPQIASKEQSKEPSQESSEKSMEESSKEPPKE